MLLLGRTVAMFGGSLANFASNNKLPSTVVHTLPSSGHIVFAPDKTPGPTENVT